MMTVGLLILKSAASRSLFFASCSVSTWAGFYLLAVWQIPTVFTVMFPFSCFFELTNAILWILVHFTLHFSNFVSEIQICRVVLLLILSPLMCITPSPPVNSDPNQICSFFISGLYNYPQIPKFVFILSLTQAIHLSLWCHKSLIEEVVLAKAWDLFLFQDTSVAIHECISFIL